jgi:hypothetical protein
MADRILGPALPAARCGRNHYGCMSANRSGGPDSREDTWTSETLPMSLRKELLERELKKLGFRKAESGGGSHGSGSVQQQQQPQSSSSSHPQAEGERGSHGE